MEKGSKIVIIGAGIFGLSTAHQLASEGYHNIIILDRHMPPVNPLSCLSWIPGEKGENAEKLTTPGSRRI